MLTKRLSRALSSSSSTANNAERPFQLSWPLLFLLFAATYSIGQVAVDTTSNSGADLTGAGNPDPHFLHSHD